MLALFTEHGPWRSQADGTLMLNPTSWTLKASMVFLEQPAGVGFSYSSLTSDNELLSNDYAASEDFVLTIRAFYDRYPERKNNTLYIASESYGGHYMPQLALKLLADADMGPLFGGMLVGNPYTSYASGELAGVATMWGLQLVDLPVWSEYERLGCSDLALSAYTIPDPCFELMDLMYTEIRSLNPYALGFPSCSSAAPGYAPNTRQQLATEQEHAQESASSRIGLLSSAFGVYSTSSQAHQLVRLMGRLRALRQNSTFSASSSSSAGVSSSGSGSGSSISLSASGSISSSSSSSGYHGRSPVSAAASAVGEDDAPPPQHIPAHRELTGYTTTDGYWLAPVVPDGLPYDPCAESYALSYLNDAAVQSAMHVLPAERERASVNFAFCSDPVFNSWSLMDSYADTTRLYTRILQKAGHREKTTGQPFNVLVFSGDSDGVCGTVGTQHWIYRVANEAGRRQMHLWQPWLMDDGKGQQGGFLTRFEGNFSFATVHAAGHEVPSYQPKAALALFAAYLDGSIFAQDNPPAAVAPPTTQDDFERSDARALQTAIAISVTLVVAFLLLLGGYFLYARRRLQHAQRMSLDAAGLQAFADVDSTHGEGEEPHWSAGGRSGRKSGGGLGVTRNPMAVSSSSSVQGLPPPAVTLQSMQEALI